MQGLEKGVFMKIKDEALWNTSKANNTDAYGREVLRYAEAWADLMETDTVSGLPLAEVAERRSHDADTNGITGFMYGCAVVQLAACWEHGEELRRWHNLKTQIGQEGESANESGGVLNPALLSIGGAPRSLMLRTAKIV